MRQISRTARSVLLSAAITGNLIAACTAQAPPMKAFSDVALGITIRYPADWQVLTQESSAVFVSDAGMLEDPSTAGAAFTVYRTPAEFLPASAENAHSDDLLALWSILGLGTQNATPEPFNLGEENGLRGTVTGREELAGWVALIMHDRYVYTITAIAQPANRWDSYAPLFEDMVRSWRFLLQR